MKINLLFPVLQFLLCLTCTAALAQQPTLEWVGRFDGKGPSLDNSTAIVLDAEGNSYITGTSYGLASHATTVKYSPAGKQLWAVQFERNSSTTAIAVDNTGGVYVTGYSSGTDLDDYYATVRYDAATGQQTWVQKYNWPGGNFDVPKGIAVDNKGGVYVTGFSENGDNRDNLDFATIRYDAATGEESWTRRYDGSGGGYDVAWAIAVDNAGGVFVTGASDSTSTDFVTIRYDAATGKDSWIRRYNSPGDGSDGGVAIATDNKGNVFVAGDSEGHYATIRYNAQTGKQVWAQHFNKSGKGNEAIRAIAVDNAGGVFVTGFSFGDTPRDYVTVRYAVSSGKETWAKHYDGPDNDPFGEDFAVGLAVDNAGGVYVTGYSGNGSYFPCDFEGCTTYNFATVRYETATGEQTWVQRYEGPITGVVGNNYAVAVAADNAGRVVVAGTGLINNSDDYITIRYAALTGEEVWVQQYNRIESTDDDAISVAVDAAGNSYVTGTSDYKATTIKYSPSGEQLWEAQLKSSSSASAIAVDNKGGIYVAGTSYSSATDDDYIMVRYDAATGKQTWISYYDGSGGDPDFPIRDVATAMTIDSLGGVYVTGYSETEDVFTDIATVRYVAATGKQTWEQRYDSKEGFLNEEATAIAVDNKGGVYITGYSYGDAVPDYITIRYAATTGKETWVSYYDGPNGKEDVARAITTDTSGGVYVTGVSDGDYTTIRYATTTGKQTWLKRYDGPNKIYDAATAIASDNAGNVYITGESEGDYTTLRYAAATGEELWSARYSGSESSADKATVITLDNAGGVYVTGYSADGTSYECAFGNCPNFDFATVRYAAATGKEMWVERYNDGEEARDIAVDNKGNVYVTGYSYTSTTSVDFLTLKYSQAGQCPDIAAAVISGFTTVSSGLSHTSYAITVPGATSYNWQITAPDGSAYTSFSGQNTSAIKVNWPDSPEAYKVSVTYAATSSCPASTATKYVYVHDTEAGFVTGGGWSDSPLIKDYELMQQQGKAYWVFGARYEESKSGSAGDPVQGTLLLVLESGQAFRSTSVEEGSLVIAGNRAYFSGTGTLMQRAADGVEEDPRSFTYLLSAIDGQLGQGKEPDKLRLLIREMNQDGSQGKVVYDNQLSCSAPILDDNAETCQQIEKGAIVIHHHDIQSISDLFATAAAEPTAQELQVYPSLVSDKATVSFSLPAAGKYSLEIYDRKGALVKQVAAGTAEAGQSYEEALSVEGMTKGLYLLRLTCGASVQTAKLVVQQ